MANNEAKPVYIYGLRCPVSGHIRYIGKSDDPDRRFKAHMSYATREEQSHKARWIRKIARDGLEPTLEIIREVADGEDWAEAERQEIARARALGWPLTNMTLGGEGATLDEAGRAAKLVTMRKPETRARMSASASAKWNDPVVGARLKAANGSPERRAKLSEGALKRATPEYRAMMAEKSRAAWADREKRDRILAGWSEESKASHAEKAREFWRTSPKAAKCRENLRQDPETLRKSLEAARAARMSETGRAKHKAATQTPEYRAKLSAALKASWARRKGT